LEDVVLVAWQLIQAQNAVMGQRHVARHGHAAATNRPRIRDGMVGGATRAGRDEGGAPASTSLPPGPEEVMSATGTSL
jgi:hypothetical protein